MIPCDCCATQMMRCFEADTPICNNPPTQVVLPTQSSIPTTTLVANPNNLTIWNPPLSQTADNNTSGGSASGFNTPGGQGQTAALGVIIDYTYTEDIDRVINIQLWNQGGGILNDNDGLRPPTQVTLFDNGGTPIFGPVGLNAGNGGAIFNTAVSGLPGLNGVRRMRLTNIAATSAGGARPLWRNIALQLAYRSVLTWNCPPATVTATIADSYDTCKNF